MLFWHVDSQLHPQDDCAPKQKNKQKTILQRISRSLLINQEEMLRLAPVATVPVAVVGIVSTIDVAKSITEVALCDNTAPGAFVAIVDAGSQRQTRIVVLIGAR